MLSVKGNASRDGLPLPEREGSNAALNTELKHLGALFAAALTQNEESSLSAWEKLLDYLENVLPSSKLKQLSEHAETQHYIHRTIKYALKHSESLKRVKIIARLSKLFPETVEQLTDEDLPFSYSYSDIHPFKKVKHKRSATSDSQSPSSLYSYSPANLAATFRGPSVRLNELFPAANKVSVEVTGIERDILHNQSLFPKPRRSISTGRDFQRSHYRSRSTPATTLQFHEEIASSNEKPLLGPLLSSEIQDEHFTRSDGNTLFPKKQVRSPRKLSVGSGPTSHMRNVYDVIEAFASGRLKVESESLHLNYTNPDRWNPYDLTIVPKTKVQPEHFVVSKFGILRVYPDETSDFQSFAEWLREASLYTMLRKITFLKHYLVKNAFKQWYRNVRFAQFVRVHEQVSRVSIRFLPDFANALLKIQSLSEELLTVPFHHLTSLSSYSQELYEHSLQVSQSKMQRFLQKYFKFCKRLVTEVIKSSHSVVLAFETEKRHKPFVSDLPLSVQKEKHSKLEHDLKAALYQESKLAEFVSLSEHMLFSCLLKLARQGAQSWRKTALAHDLNKSRESTATPAYSSMVSTPVSRDFESALGNEPGSEGTSSSHTSLSPSSFLSVSFDFDESAGTLCIHPSVSKLESLVIGPLQNISSILSSVVTPLTSSQTYQGGPDSGDCTHSTKGETKPASTPKKTMEKQAPDHRPSPPSMAPSRQPKSLMTVLKGITVSQGKSSSDRNHDKMLQSERARSQLSQVPGMSADGVRLGQGEKSDSIPRKTSPLGEKRFAEKIESDEVFSGSLTSMTTAVDYVCVELNSMCAEYSWLNSVWSFIADWEGKRRAIDMTADEYEVVLIQLYEWVRLFDLLPSKLHTSYSLLTVSTSSVIDRVYPQLCAIVEQVTSTGILQAMTLCEKVLEEIKQRAEVLSSKRYDLEGFAEYAHQLRECQLFDKSEAENISYILRVHSVLLRHGIEVPEGDKAQGKKLQMAWHAFGEKLKEAEGFVATQTPVKAQGLQESIETCEDDLRNLVNQVNTGKFTNPAGIPNELLEELKLVQEEVVAVRSRLLGLSKWKEAITGKPHDLSGVSSLLDQQFVRQELWKYRRVFDTYEKEWTKASFKKLDTGLIFQKVLDWLDACNKLEKTLPPYDPVLTAWRERLEEFKHRIPLLQQLASKALRTSHWYTIFASLGEDYNPDQPYTLIDFDLYKIYDHSDIIFEICHDAMQQEKLRAKVDELQTCLEQKLISITQFPIERYPFAAPSDSGNVSNKPDVLPKQTFTPQRKVSHLSLNSGIPMGTKVGTVAVKSTEPSTPAKTTSFAVGFQVLAKGSPKLDCLFSIEKESQLCMWLENDIIQTKVLLSSPHLGSLKMRGELLLKTLIELQEIVMLLSQCQEKWHELLSLFSQMDIPQRGRVGLNELQQATAKFQEITLSVRDDPRLLSLLGKRRGQKGFRELQGDLLRQRIQEVDSVLEVVVHKVRGHLKNSCSQFPRLCYLSDKDILKVISHSGDPMAIMPLISRVFPAIKSMQSTEIISNQSPTSFRKLTSDIEEGLQVIAIEGWHGEQLSLSVPLPLGRRTAPQWLHALEGALSYSLASALTDCLGSLPDSLLGASGSVQNDSAVIRWVTNNLSQCVQLALEISWTSVIHGALSGEEPMVHLQQTRTRLCSALDLVTNMVRSLGKESVKYVQKRSFLPILHNIILILEHKREMVKSLIATKGVTLSCFSWKSHVLYSSETDSLYEDTSSYLKNAGTLNDRGSSSSILSGASSKLNSTVLGGRASIMQRLQASSHSLVASSKSLLASRNSLLANPAVTNDLHRSGTSSFVFTSELASSRRQVPTKCLVHCGESITPYGFEYLSPDCRLVLNPTSEACLLSVVNSLARFTYCSLFGQPVSGKSETGKEIAKVLGRHHYQLYCSPATTLSNLHSLLTGAMQTGSLLLLETFSNLQPQVMILMGEWLQELTLLFTKAFKGKQSSIILTQPEEPHSETALITIDSGSTIAPLTHPCPSEEMQQSVTDPSNESFTQALSNKMVISQQTSKRSSTTLGSTLSEKISSPVSHQQISSHSTTQGNSSIRIAASSSMKTSTPLPLQRNDSPFQQSLSGRTSRATTRIDWYKMTDGELNDFGWFGYGGGPKEELDFNGDLFRVSPAFGCTLIDTMCVQNMSELPEQLRVALRSVAVMLPDLSCLTEVLLLSHGFKNAHKLSRSLAKFWKQLGYQASSDVLLPMAVNLHSMKVLIKHAATIMYNQAISGVPSSEREIIALSVKRLFNPQLTHPKETEQREECGETVNITCDLASWNKLNQLLDIYFPPDIADDEYRDDSNVDRNVVPADLVEAIKSQLAEQHLQSLPSFINKVKQLHMSLKHSRCVILSGTSGSGKTMVYNTLAAAYQHIRELRALGKSSKTSKDSKRYSDVESELQGDDYPIIDITVINPAAYSFEELFGSHQTVSYEGSAGVHQWKDGILTRILRQIQSLEEGKLISAHTEITRQEVPKSEAVVHWIVLDGPVNCTLMEILAPLISGDGMFLSTGEKINLSGTCQILVETITLSEITPSLVAHSSLMHFSSGVISFDAVVDTWLNRAPTQHNLSALSTETLATMIKQLLPETLEYLQEMNRKCLGTSYSLWASSQTYGLAETQCFLNLLSAVLERNAPKVESSVTHTSMASRSSRMSSRLSESRASSAMLTSYSSSSVQVDRSISMTSSRMSMTHTDGEPLDPIADNLADDLSECNIEAEFGLSMQLQMASILSFAYIWSLGAFCPFSELSSFNDFAREMIMQLPYAIPLPEEGSVFDYYLNLRQYQFLPWAERKGGSKGDISSSGYVSLPELDRYTYIVDLYLSYGLNAMIIGQKGTGKTSLVENLLQSRLPITRLQITSALAPCQLQEKILARMSAIEKRTGQRHAHGSRKSSNRCIFFLDNVHLASKGAVDVTSSRDCGINSRSQPSALLQLTRFASTHHQLYDYSRNYQHTLNDVRFISSCDSKEYWRLPIEFSRTFNPVPFIPPSDDCLKQIFSRSVLLWLQQFPESIIGNPDIVAEALGTASVTVIRSLTDKVHPSPSSPHLTFTLHDFMHIYEGLLLLSPDTKAQTHPQFSLLNRRGFLSSTQSGRTSRKKSSNKQKLPKNNALPTLGSNTSRVQLRSRTRGHSLAASHLVSEQPESVSTLRMIIRLWCHETTRIYLDRLVDSRDRIWFTKLLEVCIKYCFCGDDLRGSTTKSLTQRQPVGTASRGGRRIRGGSMRGGMLSQSTSSEGPSLEDLAKAGVKVDILQNLMPAEQESDGEGGLQKLLALDQVTMKGEDLTGLMFAQFPSVATSVIVDDQSSNSSNTPSDRNEPNLQDSNYAELGDGQVMDSLKKHIESLKTHSQGIDTLVLFKGAIEHASRICRVLSLPGSHALLIGNKGTGRKCLVRLMCQIFKAKLFELSAGSTSERSPGDNVQSILRDVCVSAAVDSTHTVLLTGNKEDLGAHGWENICQIMEEGLCPGLFTTSELLVMSSKLQKGRVKKTTEGARQTFAKAVRKNLHVFVVWDVDYRTSSLFSTDDVIEPIASGQESLDSVTKYFHEESMREIFSSICQVCSYVDHFLSWTKQEYTDIALRWWQQGFGNTGVIKWQDWIDTTSQLEAVGMLATHVHLTTSELLGRIYSGHVSELLSPKVFIECLRISQDLAVKFKAKEKVVADRLQSALQKLEDVDHTVYELEQQLATLKPQLADAEQEVQQRMNLITTAKEKYMAANQRCKFAEDTIKSETRNVEHFSKMVEEKFNEVFPVYHSALHALTSVEKNDTLELMGYRTPPEILKPVFNALCMLFDREQTWDDCKQLLLSPNFFENLRFFDKDNVPKRKLNRLEKMINRSSKFEMLGKGSQAVVSLCMWLNALVDYHHAKMAVQPYRESLAEAERTLMDANKTFVDMRKDMMVTKTDLEETVKLHKESVQKQRVIEVKVEGVCSKLEHASHLLTTMAKQRRKWEEKVKLTKNKIDSLPGHAVLCSAAVYYLTRVPPSKHEDLLSAWLGYCNGSIGLGNLIEDCGGLQATQGYQSHSGQQQVVRIQKDFSVAAHLSEREEQSIWDQESVFPDQSMLDRCLSSRLCSNLSTSGWPLIFDPNGHFEYYLHAMDRPSGKSKSILQINECDSLIVDKLTEGIVNGSTVLLSFGRVATANPSDVDKQQAFTLLSKILQRDYTSDQNHLVLDSHHTISVHPDFKVFIVLQISLEEHIAAQGIGNFGILLGLSGMDLSSFCVVDLGLSFNGFQNHLQKLILKYKRPEYSIRYKSLLTDLTLHQQQLKDNEDNIVNCVVGSSTSLLELSNLLQMVQESESSDVSTLELIHETNKNLRAFDQQALVYKALSEYASLLFICIQKLATCFKYFKFPLDWFEDLVGDVLTGSGKDVKVPDNLMAINAHVLHLKHQLLSKVYRALQVHLFERHQILLLLLIGLESMRYQGKLNADEVDALGKTLLTTEGHIDLVLPDTSTSTRMQHDIQKPSWINDESWCGVLQLQKSLPSFRRLSTEVVHHGSEWMEYFQMAPSLLSPVPGYGASCSMGQKLLLWKVFNPEKFSEVAKDFILLTFGADFVTTHICTINAILPYTSSFKPVLCYFSNTPSFASCLKVAASQRDREVHSVALIDRTHLASLLSQLPDLMQDGYWLIIEHCQMCTELLNMLTAIEKAILDLSETTDVHSEFRVWVPIPLHVYATSGLPQGFAFEDHPDEKHVPDSEMLLQDLKVAVNYSSAKDGSLRAVKNPICINWEEHDNIVSKLRNFVPRPLSLAEVIDLDPNQDSTQTLLSMIFEELNTHNAILVSLHSSLEDLSRFLRGDLQFSALYGDTLSLLSCGLLPTQWAVLLSKENGFPQGLMQALKLLKQRFSFYVNTLQSSTIPVEFNLLNVSKPDDLISRAMHLFATEQQLNICDVYVEALVVHSIGSLEKHGTIQPTLIFTSLSLHGATLDEQGQLLPNAASCSDVSTQLQPTQLCSIALYFKVSGTEVKKRKTNSNTSESVFKCPVVLNSNNENTFTIPLTNHHHNLNTGAVYLSCEY